jgi:hypothetical protein
LCVVVVVVGVAVGLGLGVGAAEPRTKRLAFVSPHQMLPYLISCHPSSLSLSMHACHPKDFVGTKAQCCHALAAAGGSLLAVPPTFELAIPSSDQLMEVQIYMHTDTKTHRHTYMQTHKNTRTHTSTHKRTHTHTNTQTHRHRHTCRQTDRQTDKHSHTHAHTNTHTTHTQLPMIN